MEILTTPAYRIISNHVIAEMRQNLSNGQNALFALRSFQPGDIIADFSAGTISAEPTYLTVQVGVGKHITLQPEFLQYINHGCDPNVFFNTTTMQLVALKELQPDEEMTFFYPSTEWKMTQPFNCYCGSPHCIGQIRGAAYLSKEAREKYHLTDFIQQQLVKRPARKKVA
ncbi:MAG: SET domain-containing protein-lysine N-methyltransferase [Bacteroidota bacterium]